MPIFKADPYRVNAKSTKKQATFDFGEMLKDIFSRPMDGSREDSPERRTRWGGHSGNWIVVDNLGGKQPMIGTAFHSHMSDHPLKAGNTIESLALDDDEGLGKHVAFLWDKEQETIWFQRDTSALSARKFFEYVTERTNIPISWAHVFQGDAAERVLSMSSIGEIEVTLRAGEGNEPTGVTRVAELLGLRRKYGARYFKVTMTPIPKSGLAHEARFLAREIARQVQDGSDVIKGAKIRGLLRREDGDDYESEMVNLIRDRVQFNVQVPDERTRQARTMMAAIKRIWDANRGDIPSV